MKALFIGVDVVELQGSEILPVGTNLALTTFDVHQVLLPFTTSNLLCQVRLMAVIGIPVFALPTAVLRLSASQHLSADHACRHERYLNQGWQ
ncbi:MAG: hypothetical protein WBM45_05090 [Woeseiaceae bacterium]